MYRVRQWRLRFGPVRFSLVLFSLLWIGSLLWLGSLPAQAATLTVTSTADTGAGSLRTALTTALTGDTVDFDLAGSGPHTIVLASALPSLAKNLTITGPTTEAVTVQGGVGANYSLFSVAASYTVSISNLTITKSATGITNAGTLTVSDCTISDNTYGVAGTGITLSNCILSNNGWGTNSTNGSVAATGCTFLNRTYGLAGNNTTITATNCTFASTTLSSSYGIYNIGGGSVAATGCTFSGNWKGLHSYSGTADLTDCSVLDNYYGLYLTSGATGTATTSSFSTNHSSVYNTGGTLTVTDSTISNSNVNGIFTTGGTAVITGSTLTGNGYGLYNAGPGSGSVKVTTTNCTFSNNAYGAYNITTGQANLAHCTLDNNTIGLYNAGDSTFNLKNSIVTGSLIANQQGTITSQGTNLVGGDAKLGPLQANGGPTHTFALLYGSSAIDGADDSAVPVPSTDQRGSSRPVGSARDIGAFEVQAAYSISGTVTGTASGVTMQLSAGGHLLGTVTTSGGSYTFSNVPAGVYSVTPVLSSWSFSPTQRSVTVASANVTGQNFTASNNTYSISGYITTSAMAAVANVSVTLTPAGDETPSSPVLTDSNGKYLFTGVASGTYTLTPTLDGHLFSPSTRSVQLGTANLNGQNFVTRIEVINHILSTGQSLSVGGNGAPPLSITQPYSNLLYNVVASPTVAPTVVPTPAPLKESSVETPSSGMANLMTSLSGDTFAVSRHGYGGMCYDDLKQGTSFYNTGIEQAKQLQAWANLTANDKEYRVRAVTVIHGECDTQAASADPNDAYDEADYQGLLEEWQSDYETDLNTVTAQSGTIPLFTDQVGSFTHSSIGNQTTAGIALAQLKASVDNPDKIFLVGPKYFLPYVDGVHLTNRSYRWLGEYYGKVMNQVLYEGKPWKPLSPRSITRSGAIITARFHVPVGPLVFDTSRVLEKANYGFEYTDNTGTSPTIQSVELNGADTVRITLSATPTAGNEQLGYAYTGVAGASAGPTSAGSARGNLRDSDSTPSASGDTLYNWAVHFNETVVVSTPVRKYSVSGLVRTDSGQPVASVSLQLRSGATPIGSPVTTNAFGYYQIDEVATGSYTVTPTLSGYTFSPVNYSVTVADASGNVMDRNFTAYATKSIIGRVSLASNASIAVQDVSVQRSGGSLLPNPAILTNSAGYFTHTAAFGEEVTITPTLAGYTFEPATRSVTMGTADVLAQNFAATPNVSVSGRITDSGGTGVDGIVVGRTGSAGTVTTAGGGYYTFTDVPKSTITITPVPSGSTQGFTPSDRVVVVNGVAITNQDFTVGTAYRIIGRIANSSGMALMGVSVTRTGSSVAMVTNSAGYFTFNNVPDGSYTVTPVLSGYSFTPATRTSVVSGADTLGQNFTSSP